MITDACKDIDLVNQTRVRNKEQIEDIVFLSGEVDNLGEVGIVESFSNLSVEGRVFTVRGWTWTLLEGQFWLVSFYLVQSFPNLL